MMENRIRELRKAKGLSLMKLADMCNTNHQTIQRLETGVMRLNDYWIDVISKALGVRPAELISDESLSKREAALLKKYRQLGEDEQKAVDVMLGLKK